MKTPRSSLSRRGFLGGAAVACGFTAEAGKAAVLPDTRPLTLEGDLTEMLMDGAHRFVERKIRESVSARQRHWKRDFSSPAAYEQSVAANRQRFLEKIGVVDPRRSASLESFAGDLNSSLIGETPAYRIYQVRWQVLEGVHAG